MKKTMALMAALTASLSLTAATTAAPTAVAAEPNETDRAFVNDMTRHHVGAIDMAKIARRQAEHPEIKQLARDIVRAQRSEIRLMKMLKRRLPGNSRSTLDMEDEMGMDMDMDMLERADPFDRMFIDMMIPHHQGAILMARVELDKGGDRRTRRLARDIIAAQAKEIRQMNRWRTRWYGEPSPAGGVPKDGGSMPHHGM
jgi:uncharacterized protein (DUF305 family)